MNHSSPVQFLLVEDDSVDVEAVQRSFQRNELQSPLFTTSDAQDALRILRGEAGPDAVQGPFVVLLDLNLPRMDGLEFLEALRQDPSLKDTVVFVLSTSNAERDKRAAYAHNVAGYFVKSDLGPGLESLVPLLRTYASVVHFPRASAA